MQKCTCTAHFCTFVSIYRFTENYEFKNANAQYHVAMALLVPLLELNILMSVFLVNIQFPNLASLACHSHTLSALSLFKQWLKITLMWDPLLRDPNTHETQIENSISSVSTSSKKLNFYQFNICKYVPPFYIMPNCYYL